jgi:hypothetical protein
MSCVEKRDLAFIHYTLDIPVDGSWSENIFTNFNNGDIPQIFYFAVMDCGKVTDPFMPKIEVEFELMNTVNEI